ncbi:MAG TPA: peptide chain release factor N(5)-glutamine methyltransferase [Gemmatimonadaceae bacterium]|nr:peptide chain release factor N(5)-glutamine methyltransferase [Gemmatimonadaceae bacterium]
MTAERAADAITVSRVLEELVRALSDRGMAEPMTEAREIISALLDVPRFWPIVNGGVELEASLQERARAAADRRVRGAPLAYAVGRASFRHLTLDVDERVLIPRPETEQLVDLVLDETGLVPGGIAIDIGTGSGAIAIALAAEGTYSRVYGTDVSRDAVDVARHNASLCASLLRSPVAFVHGSLLGPLADLRARVIVSNPPYIALGEAGALPASVRDWEPSVALYGGLDGMATTARLVREAAGALEPGGLLAVEVDARRASLAADLVGRDPRFHRIRVELDLAGRERFVLARRRHDSL